MSDGTNTSKRSLPTGLGTLWPGPARSRSNVSWIELRNPQSAHRERCRDQSLLARKRLKSTISPHNNSTIGELVAKAMEKVGGDAVITVEEAKTTESALDVGMQFERSLAKAITASMPGTRNTLIWRLELSIRARWCGSPSRMRYRLPLCWLLTEATMTEIPETKKKQTFGPKMAM